MSWRVKALRRFLRTRRVDRLIDRERCGPGTVGAASRARSLASILVVLAALVGCHSVHAVHAVHGKPEGDTVRLVTLNILGCRGFPFQKGGPIAFDEPSAALTEALVDRIATWRADVVVIQEAPPEAIVRQVADRTGMQVAYFPAQTVPGNDWPFGFPGAVLSRYPLSPSTDRAAQVRTPTDPRFQRHWGDVDVDVHGRSLRVASLHLCADWGGTNRESTRLAELDAVLTEPPADVIAGDFNTTPTHEPYPVISASGWRDAWLESGAAGDGHTSDTRRPHQRIDYVWLSPATRWRAASATVLDDTALVVGGRRVLLSDHFPVLVELEWT